MNESELILAIESSCDETSVAVIENGERILSNIVASQIKVTNDLVELFLKLPAVTMLNKSHCALKKHWRKQM